MLLTRPLVMHVDFNPLLLPTWQKISIKDLVS